MPPGKESIMFDRNARSVTYSYDYEDYPETVLPPSSNVASKLPISSQSLIVSNETNPQPSSNSTVKTNKKEITHQDITIDFFRNNTRLHIEDNHLSVDPPLVTEELLAEFTKLRHQINNERKRASLIAEKTLPIKRLGIFSPRSQDKSSLQLLEHIIAELRNLKDFPNTVEQAQKLILQFNTNLYEDIYNISFERSRSLQKKNGCKMTFSNIFINELIAFLDKNKINYSIGDIFIINKNGNREFNGVPKTELSTMKDARFNNEDLKSLFMALDQKEAYIQEKFNEKNETEKNNIELSRVLTAYNNKQKTVVKTHNYVPEKEFRRHSGNDKNTVGMQGFSRNKDRSSSF
jgi:hypothetical protein